MRKLDLLVKLVLSCVVAYLFMLGFSLVAAESSRVTEASTVQGLHLIKSDEQGIVLELRTADYDIEEVSVEDTVYHMLSVPGYAHNDDVGYPQLPLQATLLGIPPRAHADLRILEAEGDIVVGTYNVAPVPRPIITDDPSSGLVELDGSELVQDQSAYSENAFYPADLVRVTSSGFIRDQRFLHLQLYPFQYHPVTQQLKFYPRLRVEISFSYPEGGPMLTASGDIDGPFESVLRNTILNYQSARAWRQRSTGPTLLEVSGLECDECWKISVGEKGIYQLTHAELEAAGVPLEPGVIEPRNLHIYNRGEEIAIYVHGEGDGNFDEGDYILFYGEEVDTKYTNTNVYWLTVDGTRGLRMTDKQGEGDEDTPIQFEATARAEQDIKYYSNLPPYPSADELERWYWERLQTTGQLVTGTYAITLNNIYTEEPYSATLRSDLWGMSEDDNPLFDDHHAKVYVNGSEVHDASWDGMTVYHVDADFDSSLLVEGQNVIEVACPGDTGAGVEVVVTDWFEITYRGNYVAEGDSLAFAQDDAGTGVWEYRVGGFTQPSIEVYDVTVPISVSRIISKTIFLDSTWTLSFTQEIAAPARYLALTGPQRKSATIMKTIPYDLTDPANSAEYLIITHPDFYDSVQRLASHRSAQFATMVVDVEDIYFWFNDGIFDPHAIRDFLEYAYENWRGPGGQEPPPSYVLLVGDGNYDVKDNWGFGEPNYIPPYLACADPFKCEIAAENRYACVSGSDIMPDLYIARLPVRTPDEVDAVIDKILAYEASPPGAWRSHTLFVADNPDDEGAFDELSDYIADNHLPFSYTAQKVYYTVPPYTTPISVTRAITDAINNGRLLINYFGHGYFQFWAGEKFLEESSSRHDVESLTKSDRLPLLVSMSCYVANFVVPSPPGMDLSCLTESLVRAEGKGAVATWAAIGLGEAEGHKFMDSGFFTAVFTDGVVEVGAATTQAAQEMPSYQYLVDQFVLFGDPAMRLALPFPYKVFMPLTLKQY